MELMYCRSYQPLKSTPASYACKFRGCNRAFVHETSTRRHERDVHKFYRGRGPTEQNSQTDGHNSQIGLNAEPFIINESDSDKTQTAEEKDETNVNTETKSNTDENVSKCVNDEEINGQDAKEDECDNNSDTVT